MLVRCIQGMCSLTDRQTTGYREDVMICGLTFLLVEGVTKLLFSNSSSLIFRTVRQIIISVNCS